MTIPDQPAPSDRFALLSHAEAAKDFNIPPATLYQNDQPIDITADSRLVSIRARSRPPTLRVVLTPYRHQVNPTSSENTTKVFTQGFDRGRRSPLATP